MIIDDYVQEGIRAIFTGLAELVGQGLVGEDLGPDECAALPMEIATAERALLQAWRAYLKGKNPTDRMTRIEQEVARQSGRPVTSKYEMKETAVFTVHREDGTTMDFLLPPALVDDALVNVPAMILGMLERGI